MKTLTAIATLLLVMWFTDTFPALTASIIGLTVLVGFVALFRKVWKL